MMTREVYLDLSSLLKATNSLSEALIEMAKTQTNLFVRDATIQRFEYTYDLTYRMLKRYFEMTEPNALDIDQMSFPALIRTGTERGLLQSSLDVWSAYRTARNLTSHTYSEAKAIEVCRVIPNFLLEAQFLLKQLQKRCASS